MLAFGFLLLFDSFDFLVTFLTADNCSQSVGLILQNDNPSTSALSIAEDVGNLRVSQATQQMGGSLADDLQMG